MLIGWTIANVIGISLGLVLGFSAFARRYILASLEVLRPMPVVAFLPLALLLFNFSLTTELVLIVYASLWPVLINTMGGIMSAPPRLYDVGRTLRLSRARMLLEDRAAGRGAGHHRRLPAQHGARVDHRDHRRDAGEPAWPRLRRDQPADGHAAAAHVRLCDLHRPPRRSLLNATLMWLSRLLLRGHALASHA